MRHNYSGIIMYLVTGKKSQQKTCMVRLRICIEIKKTQIFHPHLYKKNT